MRVALLATGGKDSVLALYHILQQGYEVAYLATMIPLREDSWMFHYPNIGLIDLFADAVNIPLAKAETSGVKEEEVEDLKKLIQTLDIKGVVSGAIASNYQKERVDRICRQLNLKSIAPLWHRDQLEILQEILRLRFEVVITGVYAIGFDEGWLGRRIDASVIEDLLRLNKAYGVSIVGEGGEFETLVVDAPFYRKKIRILKAEKVWKGQSGHYLISKAQLENK
ncbi:MAG TPA: TIGR00289 family protein [Candidatus Bathyarchaeia archaeon]|nr:TIGR00289 family protein [Candidatus Bathyarchaeia archaeon]